MLAACDAGIVDADAKASSTPGGQQARTRRRKQRRADAAGVIGLLEPKAVSSAVFVEAGLGAEALMVGSEEALASDALDSRLGGTAGAWSILAIADALCAEGCGDGSDRRAAAAFSASTSVVRGARCDTAKAAAKVAANAVATAAAKAAASASPTADRSRRRQGQQVATGTAAEDGPAVVDGGCGVAGVQTVLARAVARALQLDGRADESEAVTLSSWWTGALAKREAIIQAVGDGGACIEWRGAGGGRTAVERTSHAVEALVGGREALAVGVVNAIIARHQKRQPQRPKSRSTSPVYDTDRGALEQAAEAPVARPQSSTSEEALDEVDAVGSAGKSLETKVAAVTGAPAAQNKNKPGDQHLVSTLADIMMRGDLSPQELATVLAGDVPARFR